MALAIFKGLTGNKVDPIIHPTPHNENAKLKVLYNTYLKPSTDQSSDISPDKLKSIKVGEYDINLLADEEAHYLITFDNKELFGNGRFYIYHEHCEIL